MFSNLPPEAQAFLAAAMVAAGVFIREAFVALGRRTKASADKFVTQTKVDTNKLLADAELQIMEQRLRLEMQQMFISESKYHRDLIDELNSNLAVKEEKISGLTLQQEKNVAKIQELEDKAKLRHDQIDQQAAREAALNNTILDLQSDLQRCKDEVAELKSSGNQLTSP